MTTASGTFTSCGPSQDALIRFTCTGSSCVDLNGFPGITCSIDGDTMTCTNGVVCSGPSNYTTSFQLSQTNILVSQTQKIVLSDFCEEIDLTTDGSTGGTNASYVNTGNCGPGSSNTTSTTSTTSTTKTSSTTLSTSSSTTSSLSKISTTSSATSSTQTSTKPSSTTWSAWEASSAISADPSTTTWSEWNKPADSTTYTTTWADWHGPTGASTSASPASTNVWSNVSASTPGAVKPAGSSSTTANAPLWSPYKSAASSSRPIGMPLLTTIVLTFSILLQGAFALDYPVANFAGVSHKRLSAPHLHRSLSTPQNLPSLNVYDRALTPGWKKFSDLLAEYLGGKLSNGGEFADNLVDELAEAVCDHAAGVVITNALGVDLVEECVAIIYAGNALTAPELEFMSVLYASILCNYLVAEVLPGIGALTDAVCKQPKPCSDNLLSDPKNCGTCGNVCSTGVCANGACTSNTCTGQTCSTFGPCGPGGSCVCASTSESTGFCVDGSTPCAGLAACSDSGDCGSGEVCAVATCCGSNVCVGATFCGGSTAVTKRFVGLPRGEFGNATIASRDVWVG